MAAWHYRGPKMHTPLSLLRPVALALGLIPLGLAALPAQDAAAAHPAEPLHAVIDAVFAAPWDAAPLAAARLFLVENDTHCADLERTLRAGMTHYPEPPQPRGVLTKNLPLPCDHVDHETKYWIYVPKSYDPTKATPVLLVVHGGSATRDLAFGARAARAGIEPFWVEEAEQRGWLLVAPLTDRGWMWIGNSILFSALSRVQREYHVDPDRVYLTGHSMGGHMTWRSAFQFPDRFAAVSPMSGGYDYVKSKDVTNLLNVPGYTTFGTEEPYQINEFNKIIGGWMKEHRYPWTCQEKPGGHTIFVEEVPKIGQFFADHPRDLYRPSLFVRMGLQPMQFLTADKNEGWGKEHQWNAERPIAASTVHWLRCFPREAEARPEQRAMMISAQNLGANHFELVSENARKVRIYLHPKMVDFGKPVVVMANGEKVFDAKVTPSAATMLELAREFDDRGRIFWAAIDVEIATDRSPGEPFGPKQ